MMNVKLQLFAAVAKQPAFHQLRSVEQLGYITVLMQRYEPICSSELVIMKFLIYIFPVCGILCPHIKFQFCCCRDDFGVRGVQFIIQSTIKVYMHTALAKYEAS